MLNLLDYETLLIESKTLIDNNKKNLAQLKQTYKEIIDIEDFIKHKENNMLTFKSAANLLSNLLDNRMQQALDFITTIINDALRKTFTRSFKKVVLDISTFKNSYPQLNVKLITKEGVRNLKTQEGTGLKQIISILYVLCLIYISGSRRFVYLDEVMDGLHEDAIEIMDTMLDIFVKDLGFQIIINEHGYPIGENTVAYFIDLKSEGTEVVDIRKGSVDVLEVNGDNEV